MNKILIVDLNRQLIQAAKKVGLNAIWGDYFQDIQSNEVLITASNPKWTFGGGIDAVFAQKYPGLVGEKQDKGGGMERIKNVVFAITVDENYRATKEIVEKAVKFGLYTLKKKEVLRLSGLGTGIGGLSIEEFIDILNSPLNKEIK